MRECKVYKTQKAGLEIRASYDELLKLLNTEVNELDIEGQYGTTHVIEYGDKNKQALVMFHGVGDDAALMWVYNAKTLGENFHVFAVDTIGGPGKSVPGKGYDDTFDDVLWIDELLDKLNLVCVNLACVSNGAHLTQVYSLMRPERVIKGISMAGLPIVTDAKNKSAKGKAMLAMFKIFMPEALLPTDKNVVRLIRKMTGDNYRAFTDNELVMRHFKQLMTGFNRGAMLNHKVRGFSYEEV